MVDMLTYDPGEVPGYADICAYGVEGDCCEPDIRPGDVALVSKAATADLAGGGMPSFTHLPASGYASAWRGTTGLTGTSRTTTANAPDAWMISYWGLSWAL